MIHPVFVVNCTKICKGLPFPCTDLKKSTTKQLTNKILSHGIKRMIKIKCGNGNNWKAFVK